MTSTLIARGVYRGNDSFAGTVVYRVYDCSGKKVIEIELDEDWCDENTMFRLCASLDERCPERCNGDHSRRAATLPTFYRSLRVL